MIRKTLLAAATAIVLGAGFVGLGTIAAPTTAQAQWRDYDRPSYGGRRYERERGYRQRRDYGDRRGPRGGYGAPAPAVRGAPQPGFRAGPAPAAPRGTGYRPGQQLPGGQTYETQPGRQGPGGFN